jgi:hypothetical protein
VARHVERRREAQIEALRTGTSLKAVLRKYRLPDAE